MILLCTSLLLLFIPHDEWHTVRSSHQRCSIKKHVLRNFTKFTGKRLCQSFLFNKVAGPRPATLLKRRLGHRCFPVNFVKFLRTPFLQNTSGRLLLELPLICFERLQNSSSLEVCKFSTFWSNFLSNFCFSFLPVALHLRFRSKW